MSTLLSANNKKPSSNSAVAVGSDQSYLRKMTQCYQADQQVKYLHLQAEIDVLIQQLRSLKGQNQS